MAALRSGGQLGEPAINSSRGCGGVMRVAPCAFFCKAFEFAANSARLTSGHPTGYLAAGLFADILQRLDQPQCDLQRALDQSLETHGRFQGMDETRLILERY